MRKLTLLLAIFFTLSNCSNQSSESAREDVTAYLQESENDNIEIEAPRTAEPPAPPVPIQTTSAQPAKKYVIKTAEIQMEVNSIADSKLEISNLCRTFNAEITKEQESGYSSRKNVHYEIRVVPEKFDTIILALDKLSKNTDRKAINSKDVSKEFVDLETRLASKRAVIERYREILKSAKSVQEILEVENYLRQVIEEVEAVEGNLKYLKDQVNFSTIDLDIYEEIPYVASKRRGFGSRIGRAFSIGWYSLISFLVGLVSIWPFLLLIAVILFLLRNRIWLRKPRV